MITLESGVYLVIAAKSEKPDKRSKGEMPGKYVHVHHEPPAEEDYRVKASEASTRFRVNAKTILRWADVGFLCYRRTAGGWKQLSELCVETQLTGLKVEPQLTGQEA